MLSDLGRRQADAVHAALAPMLDTAPLLASGDLRRQLDTAVPWTADGTELQVDSRWNEYDSEQVLGAHADVPASLEAPGGSGTLTSRRFQEILDPALERWIASDPSWTAFKTGALDALRELASALGSGQTGIAFTSGGTIAACAAALLGAPDRVFVALNRTAVNTGVTRIISGRRGLSLVSYNEHGHLEKDQLSFR